MSDINWAAAPPVKDIVGDSARGAAMGYELGQKRAMIHALQGIDLNSPESVDAGIGNLVRANAGEQANALQNLAFTRSLRQQIPGLLGKLTGAGDSPQTTPAQQEQAADPQHMLETFNMAKGAADKLLQLPAEQRPAAFAQIKDQMMARGIPEDAINAAGKDLSDQGLSSLSEHYGQLAAHVGHMASPQDGVEAPPMAGSHPSNAWYNNVVNDPQIPIAVGLMKSAGIDLSPYLEQARAMAMPEVNKAAELKYAGPLAATAAAVDIEKQKALVPTEVQKAVETRAGTLPYDVALARAHADIAAGHDFISVPEVDDRGQPTGRVSTYRKDAAIQAGAGGKPIGTAQSPAEATGKGADASLFMKNYEAESKPEAIRADINARDLALATAKMAQTVNPSNLTPWIAKNANTLNGLGIKIASADANKLATYQNLVAQNLKGAIQVFPQNQAEFHAIENAVASATQPGDAAALALTETAAIRDAAAKQKQFRVAWAAQNPGKYSEREFQTAWSKQPGAQQSMFASPLFQDLKINGKPAVAVAPAFKDGPHAGQVWGVFMPGTPQKTPFRVR